jgi:hypothetical protein
MAHLPANALMFNAMRESKIVLEYHQNNCGIL